MLPRPTPSNRNLSIGLTAFFLLFFLAYMWQLRPLVIFMDSLRFLGFYDDSITGKRSIWATWNQNEHRGFLPQLYVYLNAKLFGLRALPGAAMSGAVIAISAIILSAESVRTMAMDDDRSSAAWRWVAPFFVFLVSMFSLANWELFSVDVGATLFAKNLAFYLYWIALDRFLESTDDGKKKLFLPIFAGGPFVILFIGFGWSYAFVLASIGCTIMHRPHIAGKNDLRWKSMVIASLVISILLYVIGGSLIPNTGAKFEPSGTPSTVNSLQGLIFAFSAVFLPNETMQRLAVPVWLPLIFGSLTLALAFFVLGSSTLVRRRLPTVPMALLLYSVANACAVAYARGRFDPVFTAAPRYFMDLSLLIVALVWWAVWIAGTRNGIAVRTASWTVTAVVAVFICGQVATAFDEWRMAKYRHEGFEKMRAITLSNALSAEDASVLQQPLSIASRGVAIQASHGLGPFRHDALP